MDTAILTRKEELVPELKAYLHHKTFPMIQHPLVYSVPHFQEMNAFVNAQLKHKTEAVEKALKKRDFVSYVFLHERPYRFQAIQKIAADVKNSDYWKLLSQFWIDSENIWQNKEAWRSLLLSQRPGRHHFMSMADREALASLPDKVTIYRGYDARKGDPHGFSYTLNPDIAKKFARRFYGSLPEVKTRTISKEEILAYTNRRGEEEIITLLWLP